MMILEMMHDSMNAINSVLGFEEMSIRHLEQDMSTKDFGFYIELLATIADITKAHLNRDDSFIYQSAYDSMSDEFEDDRYLIEGMKFDFSSYKMLEQAQQLQLAAMIKTAKDYFTLRGI